MKKNIYGKYTILATFLLTVLFGTFSSAAPRNVDSDSTTRSRLLDMEPSTKAQQKPHIGLQIGYAEPERSGYDAATQLGVEVGYQPYIPLAAAIELTTFTSDADSNADLRRTNLMAKGTYNFGGSTPIIRQSFVGAAIGPVFDDQTGDNELNLGVKFLAGVDFPLTGNGLTRSKSFSLGATASYLAVMNAQDNFLLNGQVKYWF